MTRETSPAVETGESSGRDNRAAMISRRSCDLTAAAARWASSAFSHDRAALPANTATSTATTGASGGHAPVPGTACSPSMPGAAANTDAMPRLSTQACTTVSTAVTPPIPTPAARYQRVAAARRSSRGSTGPRARRPDGAPLAPGETRRTASDWTPSFALSGMATGAGYAATATSSGMFAVLMRLRKIQIVQAW